MILRADVTDPSNFRATRRLDAWLKARGVIGLSGVDTRALTAFIRERGMPNAVIAHHPGGHFDRDALIAEAAAWPGIFGMDLVPEVTSAQRYGWDETTWTLDKGYGRQSDAAFKVVAIDYGVKRNILRLLADSGCAVTVVPASTSGEAILAMNPDGVFLSNGPGDPAETGLYAVPVIKTLLDRAPAAFRDLPWPSDAGAGGRRAHPQDEAGPSRRQPSSQGLHDRKGRNRLDEPRLRDRPGYAAGQRGGRPMCRCSTAPIAASP